VQKVETVYPSDADEYEYCYEPFSIRFDFDNNTQVTIRFSNDTHLDVSNGHTSIPSFIFEKK